MKIFKFISFSILAFSFLFHAPLQWSSVFVHAEEVDMQMDMEMDHEAEQDCFEHCMNQAAEMVQHPVVSIPVIIAVIDVIVGACEPIRPHSFHLPAEEIPPDDQVGILTIQKRE